MHHEAFDGWAPPTSAREFTVFPQTTLLDLGVGLREGRKGREGIRRKGTSHFCKQVAAAGDFTTSVSVVTDVRCCCLLCSSLLLLFVVI